MRNVYINTHQNKFIYLVQKYFISVANQSQNEFQFHEIDIGYSDRALFSNPNKKNHADELLKVAFEIKQKYNISNEDLMLLFFDSRAYDEEDDDLFFITVEPDDKTTQTPGVAIFSTNYTKRNILGKNPSKILIANSILLNLVSIIACYFAPVDLHADTTGCVLDYCDKMEDIKYSLKNGFTFCDKKGCYKKMFSTLNGRAILKISHSLKQDPIKNVKDLNKLTKIEDSRMSIIGNPIWKNRKFIMDPKLCFILMPFNEPFSNYMWKMLKDIIKTTGLNPVRADDLVGSIIMEDIWSSINQARLLIAEMSKRNANVFYELGIAHTLGKEVILISQSKEDIPFDLTHHRVLIYSDNKPGYEKLEKELPKMINRILNEK
jgi:hypothetical protein